MEDFFIEVAGALIGGAIGGVLMAPYLIRRWRKLRERGVAVMVVRLIEGQVEGLGRKPKAGKWTIGVMGLSLGRISIPIASIETSQRRLSFREGLRAAPNSVAVIAESHSGRLEIIVSQYDIDWVTAALRQDASEAQA